MDTEIEMRAFTLITSVILLLQACQQPKSVPKRPPTASSADRAADQRPTTTPSSQAPVVRDEAKFTSLDELFASSPHVQAAQVASVNTTGAVYQVSFQQPLDHNDASAGYFEQKVVLIHRGVDRPTVLSTEGYENLTADHELELTKMYSANQISVEYRYFGKSKPLNDANNTYLNIQQAAADHHAITKFFQQYYAGSWVNTGVSKGGMSAIFHRRFYPDDVDATVPYVAPISFAAPDTRYTSFLKSIGTATCRSNMTAFQKRALQLRSQVGSMFRDYANRLSPNAIPDQMTAESYIEYFVADFAWSFWQYFGVTNCCKFPNRQQQRHSRV